MKKMLALLVCLSLLVPCALAETVPEGLSYAAQEEILPAAGMMLYIPSEMDTMEGDMAAYDLGFRYECYNDTFLMSISVYDAREMSPADYAAFYAGRRGYTAAPDTINGFSVFRLTQADKPNDFIILVSMPDENEPLAVYSLSFSCDTDEARALANEILSTLTLWE